jgi:hypothetical protein
MATVFERHQAGTGNGLRNVLGSEEKEVVVACDDERRDIQALELGMQELSPAPSAKETPAYSARKRRVQEART